MQLRVLCGIRNLLMITTVAGLVLPGASLGGAQAVNPVLSGLLKKASRFYGRTGKSRDNISNQRLSQKNIFQ